MAVNLIHGDCMQEMKNIPDGSVDMILADPPYGATKNKWDSILPLENMWFQLNRIIKPNGAIVLTASQPFTSTLVSSNINMFKSEWIWVKNKGSGHLNANKMPMKFHESVLVFYKKPPVYNPQMTSGHSVKKSYKGNVKQTENYGFTKPSVYKPSAERHPRNLIKINVVNNDGSNDGRFHPNQKPVELMEYFIKTYTNEHDIVIDFTMGVASTGVACLRTNRSFIGIEADHSYFQQGQKRMLSEWLFNGC